MKNIPVKQIKEPGFSDSFSIRDIGDMLSGNDLVQELHRHNFFLILVLEKGKGQHTIDFNPYSVNDYSVFFMRPGQVHELTLKNGCTGYIMQFSADFYSPHDQSTHQTFLKVSNKNYCSVKTGRFKRLFSIVTAIFQEYKEKQDKYKEVIKANLDIFFIELARQSKNPSTVSKNESPYAQERLEEFLHLVQTNITNTKQVAEYAEMMHLSTFQLNKITKEAIGKNCSQVINEQIILEAKRNLLATTSQVNQIAYDLGFEDPSYFIRFFKKQTHLSPEAFRKNFK